MEDEDEVDVLGDFCLNLETDLNHYDAGEFPTQNSELLGDYMQHPWLLDNSQVNQVWYFDHPNEDKNKTIEAMLHDEKKHFPTPTVNGNNVTAVTSTTLATSKVSPMWTKDDIDSLRKGIELHNQDWSKVARIVGTKTTLQVKSYIKSHPELVSFTIHRSRTPSPPQFINEVEVANEETVTHFSVGDIVDEAEIPASIEEVIPSMTLGLGWSSPLKVKKQYRPRLNKLSSKDQRKEKNVSAALTVKKGPGRPRKVPKDSSPLVIGSDIIENGIIPLPMTKPVPILEGEIIRLQRVCETEGDSMSDSEIDIDCSDDDGEIPIQTVQSTFKIEDKSEETRNPEPVPTGKQEIKNCELNASEVEVKTFASSQVESECKSECDSSETDTKSSRESEPQQPIFTFPTPLEERIIDLNIITDEEKRIHWDFFEGRVSKTPERYIKIRNSIVQEWRRVKPRYLTKTSVRPSLKNCGDVNCISRVHAYLELTGTINFNCDQVQYNRPLPPVPSHRERVANSGTTNLSQQLSLVAGLPARARKKRPHPSESCDENGGGYTISHDGSQIIVSNPPMKQKPKKKIIQENQTNPFELVQCINFGTDKTAPFNVKLSMQALLVVDIHSHLCTTEVIGLLGGHFYPASNGSQATLLIEAAQPCLSQSTNHQCEMCPVSQSEGSEELRSRGLEVVGWYHSHPTFPAFPSVRDIHTQNEYQQWFSRQEAPFVGVIVNPFDSSSIKASLTAKSMIRCITVEDDLPYRHNITIDNELTSLDEVKNTLSILRTNLDSCPTLVPLDSKYPYLAARGEDGAVDYAKKAVLSMRAHLEKNVTTTLMEEMEKLAENFLYQLTLRHNEKVTVVPVPSSSSPFNGSS